MRRIWSKLFLLRVIGAGLVCSSNCLARPIDASVVLQICDALANKAPDRMPEMVSARTAGQFIRDYAVLSEKLEGCLSATETRRSPDTISFLLQNTRYESYWSLYTDADQIKAIVVERFRPVTLAEDEDWIWSGSIIPGAPEAHYYNAETVYRDDFDLFGSKKPGPNIVEFLYATNRTESNGKPRLERYPEDVSTVNGLPSNTYNGWTVVSGYTGERADSLSFGAIRVRVPEGHEIGKLELPPELRLFGFRFVIGNDPKKYFTLQSIERTDEKTWINSLSRMNGRRALIFVHGFNTKFQDAAFRTAQIIWDLQFHGIAILFSWPSRGEIADYIYDKESALGSRNALLHVIADLHEAGVDEVDVIAHSMGNLIAVDALANSAATQSPGAIAQLVMAAPDVDRDLFIQEIPMVARVAKGLTLYASANDKALLLSKRVAGNIPRAGDVPTSGPIVLPSMATIDVSVIGDEIFGLNHNMFATTRNVLNDMKILLETGAPPPRLAEIRGYPEPPEKLRYFRYVP